MKIVCFIILIIITFLFFSCLTNKSNSILEPGTKSYFSVDGILFTLIYIPGGYTFPTGTFDTSIAIVSDPYWIGETEVTNQLWYKVYTWAMNNGYSFANAYGYPNEKPVSNISWRDSIVWCNALTEWYNTYNKLNRDLTCVYYTDKGYKTPIRSCDNSTTIIFPNPGGQDDPCIYASANGFRLLTSDEWELAARWREDSTNTVSGYTYPYFTKGNSASGAITNYEDNRNGFGEPGKSAINDVAVYRQYWDGSTWQPTGIRRKAAVKTKQPNSLGIYDMSGNVREWCFDWDTLYFTLFGKWSLRVLRGGGWIDNANYLSIGSVPCIWPYYESNYIGFRFARNAE